MGVTRIALFGSYARGDATPESDIDLLFELDRPLSFRNWMDLWNFMEDSLGRSVDLVPVKNLRPEIHKQVLAEAINVALS